MIGELTLSQAAIAYGGTLLYPDCHFAAVSTDSRTLQKNELFVALQGENFDGHDFVEAAASKACGLVVARPDKRFPIPQWVVPDTTLALGQLARLNRNRFTGPLVALTGSSGKTTVKEMITAILSLCGPTLSTRGNLNNHIGVPKTLFGLEQQHRFAVVEMGASGPGEIAYLCDIARPDIALVNNVMAAHIEGFGSESAIADTKGAIYSSLAPGGTAVINLDDRWSRTWRAMAGSATILAYSLEDGGADIGVSALQEIPGVASRFTLRIGARSREVFLPLPGRHNVANALAAAGCAHAAGAGIDNIVAGLEAARSVKGRMEAKPGKGGCRVLDDTYNANPGSVKAAIDVLAAVEGEKILVLGDMAELGSLSGKSHRDVGQYALDRGIDQLFVTGRFGEQTARGFGPGTRIFGSKKDLAQALLPCLGSSTTVLVKGSRSSAMEEVVAQLVVAQISEEGEHASLVG